MARPSCVVDDEASILTITSQTLQAFGYRVLTATDGAEALALYAQHKDEIAVVLTDMMMPVMDGAAMIHAIARINPEVKIIAASGLNASESPPQWRDRVKHFLTKPYTAGTLLKTIRRFFRNPDGISSGRAAYFAAFVTCGKTLEAASINPLPIQPSWDGPMHGLKTAMSRPPNPRALPKPTSSVLTLFRRASIRRKLMLMLGIKALVPIAVCFTAIIINSNIKIQVEQINKSAIDKAEGVSSMAESLRDLRWHRAEWLLNEARLNGAPADAASTARAAKIAKNIRDTLDVFENQGILACRDTVQYAIETGTKHGQAQVVEEARQELTMLDEIKLKFNALANDLKAGLPGHPADTHLDLASGRIDADFDALNVPVEDYEAQMKHQDKHQAHEVEHDLRRANSIFIAFCVLVVLLNVGLAGLITKLISRPLEKLKNAAQEIGQGKLDGVIELPSKDEFGLLAGTLNRMRNDLRSTTVSKDYFDSILKSMANTLIVLRADRTIRSANRAALELLGYDSFDLVDQPMDAVLRDLSSRSMPALDEVVQKGSVNEAEVQYLTREERLVPMTFSASTLFDFSGLVSGYICVAQDISERKRAEVELAKANRSLMETSRHAGMAEVATSVLHNVGNVLNSVNVSCTLIAEKMQMSKLGNLSKAVALLEQHQADLAEFFTNNPKGRQLPGYLSKLAANLDLEQKEVVEEAGALTKNILHIRDIVAMQQNYASVGGLTEKLDLRDLIEDAVRINIGALERHQVKLEREYAELPPIVVDKHKVLQILVNLIRNAKYACDDSGRDDKRIVLRVTQENAGVRIAVIDNGVGIPEENRERIFCHGFTTRKEGHGFGLHSGALAAREMGGSLTAGSEGLGRGATFTLEIPLTPPEKR